MLNLGGRVQTLDVVIAFLLKGKEERIPKAFLVGTELMSESYHCITRDQDIRLTPELGKSVGDVVQDE